jgi:hypothetical protein
MSKNIKEKMHAIRGNCPLFKIEKSHWNSLELYDEFYFDKNWNEIKNRKEFMDIIIFGKIKEKKMNVMIFVVKLKVKCMNIAF